MYYNPCKNCKNAAKCKSMMNMPMMNMPMMNMPMMNMPMTDMPMTNMPMTDMPMTNMPMTDMPMTNMPMTDMPMADMPMMNMPMANMPMMNMPEHMDDDLKIMYPKIYIRIYPMVKHQCDMMESKYGKRHCPSKDDMDRMCKEISDKCEEHHRDDEMDDSEDNDTRQRRRYDRRRGIQDLVKILIIGDLIGRRRRNIGYWG